MGSSAFTCGKGTRTGSMVDIPRCVAAADGSVECRACHRGIQEAARCPETFAGGWLSTMHPSYDWSAIARAREAMVGLAACLLQQTVASGMYRALITPRGPHVVWRTCHSNGRARARPQTRWTCISQHGMPRHTSLHPPEFCGGCVVRSFGALALVIALPCIVDDVVGGHLDVDCT